MGGTERESVGFHWGSEEAHCALLLCSTHIKRLTGPANYRPNFQDILVSFFLLPLWLHPSEVLPSNTGTASWRPHRLSNPATVIATTEPTWRWWWAGPALASLRPQTDTSSWGRVCLRLHEHLCLKTLSCAQPYH